MIAPQHVASRSHRGPPSHRPRSPRPVPTVPTVGRRPDSNRFRAVRVRRGNPQSCRSLGRRSRTGCPPLCLNLDPPPIEAPTCLPHPVARQRVTSIAHRGSLEEIGARCAPWCTGVGSAEPWDVKRVATNKTVPTGPRNVVHVGHGARCRANVHTIRAPIPYIRCGSADRMNVHAHGCTCIPLNGARNRGQ